MAIKGPSFAGPLTGWSSASLVPNATVAATTAPPLTTPSLGATSDISKFNLTPAELGTAAPDFRRVGPQATPLESLLAAMFPDAAADFNPQGDPMADPRNRGEAPSLLNTILGNLAVQPSAATVAAPVVAPSAFVAPTIPGAPAFLAPAVANLGGFGGVAVPAPSANPLNSLAAVSAVAAEQRIQAAEQEKARKQAETDYFQMQQEQQKAKTMAAQRQRQRLGFAPSATNSGWASPPTFF